MAKRKRDDARMTKGDWRLEMISDLVNEIDYDIWKSMFYYPGTDGAENELEDDEEWVQTLLDIVEKYQKKHLK